MELKGKTINFLGDSITEGVKVENLENRYDNVLKRKYGLKEVYNYGVGGTRFAHQSKPSITPRHDLYFCGRAYYLNKQADITIVYGGVNDYLHGNAPIGKDGDKTPETFYGAVEWLMTFLKGTYSNSKIVFLTPARKQGDETPNRLNNEPLITYVNIILKKAKQHNIPIFDMYHNLGLDPNEDEICEKYTADGLHFNDAGHAVIAEKVAEFLESL